MPISGYTDYLPSDVLLGVGVVMVGAAKFAAVKGSQFNPNREIVQVEVEGNTGPPLKGLDRLFHGEPVLSGTLIELGEAATGNQMAKLEPGSSSNSTGSPNVTTITPATGGGFVTSYLQDVRVIWDRGVGSGTKRYYTLYMPWAIVKTYGPIQSDGAKGVASCPFEICGRRDPASGNMGDPAHKIEYREALPT